MDRGQPGPRRSGTEMRAEKRISVPAIKLRASGSLGSRAAYAAVIGPGSRSRIGPRAFRSSGTACIYHRPISAWFSSLSPLSCCDARGAARSDQFDARAPGDSSPDRSNSPGSSPAPTRPASPTRPSGPAARHRRRPGNGLKKPSNPNSSAALATRTTPSCWTHAAVTSHARQSARPS
jgi:hypothetical protein